MKKLKILSQRLSMGQRGMLFQNHTLSEVLEMKNPPTLSEGPHYYNKPVTYSLFFDAALGFFTLMVRLSPFPS